MKPQYHAVETFPLEVLLVEVAMEAREKFRNRRDEDLLVISAVNIAREMLLTRPAVTDFVADIAIATSRSMVSGQRYAA